MIHTHCGVKITDIGSGPNSTLSYYSVPFHVYRLLLAPSIIDNVIYYTVNLGFFKNGS